MLGQDFKLLFFVLFFTLQPSSHKPKPPNSTNLKNLNRNCVRSHTSIDISFDAEYIKK